MLLLFGGHAVLITRRKQRIKEKTRKLNEEFYRNRRRFLQRLDHELKNPLTAIRAGLTNISSETLNEYLARETAAVQSQALRISQLVADLRKLASLEEMTLDRAGINLPDLLEGIVEGINEGRDLGDRELLLITPSAPWPLPEIMGDTDLLLLAVHNLIDNALKFTDPGDTVEVRAHEEGNYVVIDVADTGRGIPNDEQDRIWEELYRGTQSHGVSGSGLGLPLVAAIVEKHGGKVSLLSKPGKGSVFSLYLPLP
jgi:two-component system OmpR family sensor kinase